MPSVSAKSGVWALKLIGARLSFGIKVLVMLFLAYLGPTHTFVLSTMYDCRCIFMKSSSGRDNNNRHYVIQIIAGLLLRIDAKLSSGKRLLYLIPGRATSSYNNHTACVSYHVVCVSHLLPDGTIIIIIMIMIMIIIIIIIMTIMTIIIMTIMTIMMIIIIVTIIIMTIIIVIIIIMTIMTIVTIMTILTVVTILTIMTTIMTNMTTIMTTTIMTTTIMTL
jgi:amino acid transporter